MRRTKEYFRGSLLCGAIGDALGWPVEFMSYRDIVKRYGRGGIASPPYREGKKAEITDDTQMTLFTAEGILRGTGAPDPLLILHRAYLRWLYTQGYHVSDEYNDGWLIRVKELHAPRAPGSTCLSALLSGDIGRMEQPINMSKGCGGVMRVAPVGLYFPKEHAFEVASKCAALTHGHPSGYLSAGVLAHIIACIIEGAHIQEALDDALRALSKYEGSEECLNIILMARDLAETGQDPKSAIDMIGEGWVGEETLAISIYCALKYNKDFRGAMVAAVNHDGDSDSTGAITGNILGAYLGVDAIPKEWLRNIELVDVIIQVADDLLIGFEDTEGWRDRYPNR